MGSVCWCRDLAVSASVSASSFSFLTIVGLCDRVLFCAAIFGFQSFLFLLILSSWWLYTWCAFMCVMLILSSICVLGFLSPVRRVLIARLSVYTVMFVVGGSAIVASLIAQVSASHDVFP